MAKVASIPIFLLLTSQFVDSANILFIHQLASASHRVVTQALADRLVLEGHNITYISARDDPNPTRNPNITNIIPERLKYYNDEVLGDKIDIQRRISGYVPPVFLYLDPILYFSCKELLLSQEVQSWLKTSPNIDLIYADTTHQCASGLGYKLNAKVAVISVVPLFPHFFDILGISSESSSAPTMEMDVTVPMTFFQRVKNTWITLAYRVWNCVLRPWYEDLMRTALEIPDMPGLKTLEDNLTLILYNGGYLSEHVRSLPPMFISVPALHVKETIAPLPQEVEEFLARDEKDGDPDDVDGFVYISLGTAVKTHQLPEEIVDAFVEWIHSFPTLKFLWTWSTPFPRNKPDNLYTAPWFSQQDVLGHAKIKAFLTQTGRPSSQEALVRAVPMITIPVIGDQNYNAGILAQVEVSINIDIATLTADSLKTALNKILDDKSFKERCLKVSKRFQDLPMKPLDTAVWWTEYILRNDDFSHLKSLGRHDSWFRRSLLDIWLFTALLSTVYLRLGYIFIQILRDNIFSTKVKQN